MLSWDGAITLKRTTPTYGVSVAINTSLANWFSINANNGVGFMITNPTNPPTGPGCCITITIRNASAGRLGAVVWDTLYKLATWTSPATGFSRSITFGWDGTDWVEVSRTPSDVPN